MLNRSWSNRWLFNRWLVNRWLVVGIACIAVGAVAQDDDDLAPLAPIKKQPPKPKPKPPAKPAPKPPPAKPKPAAAADDDLAPIAVTKGDVLVRATGLTGATLSIDGKEVGALPMAAQSVSAGEHTVMVKRIGYANFIKKVTVTAGKTTEVDAKLQAVAAVLSVTSDAEAQVFINGKLIGSTPLTEREWPAGTYEVSIRREGYKEDKQTLTFVAGKDYPIAVKFGPLPPPVAVTDRPERARLTPSNDAPVAAVSTSNDVPIVQRWYFWAGVAAVVAAVAIGVAVGVTSANASPRMRACAEVCSGTGGCQGQIGYAMSACMLTAASIVPFSLP